MAGRHSRSVARSSLVLFSLSNRRLTGPEGTYIRYGDYGGVPNMRYAGFEDDGGAGFELVIQRLDERATWHMLI